MTTSTVTWQFSEGLLAWRAEAADRAAGVVEDIEFMMKRGETNPDVLAKRVGYPKKTSLERYLYRHGYRELAHQFSRYKR